MIYHQYIAACNLCRANDSPKRAGRTIPRPPLPTAMYIDYTVTCNGGNLSIQWPEGN